MMQPPQAQQLSQQLLVNVCPLHVVVKLEGTLSQLRVDDAKMLPVHVLINSSFLDADLDSLPTISDHHHIALIRQLKFTTSRESRLNTVLLSCNEKQEAPLPRRAQRVRRAQLVYFMTFIGRQKTDQQAQLINHLYETGHETYRITRNNAK